MGFLSKLIGRQTEETTDPIEDYKDFWNWFGKRQADFRKFVKTKDSARIEREIFRQLSGALGQLGEGFYFLVGMLDDSTAELVLTADGNPKKVVFVEELAAAARAMPGWQFTPLKQPAEGFSVRMNGTDFGTESLAFYPNDHEDMPDLVDITVVHQALDASDGDWAKQGAYIFLDNFLGELTFLTEIDELSFRGPSSAEKDLIPIEALPNYLETRKALFAEKYEGVRIFTDNDNYSLLEAELDGGKPLVATVNTDLLQ